MIHRVMRGLFAALVMVAFGCMPTLALASPATASPPMVVCDVAPETVAAEPANYYADPPSPGDSIALDDQRPSTSLAAPAHPLRE